MKAMKEQHNKGAPAAADLLVCFPSRAHLRLMPKPICSPARPSDQPNKRHQIHRLKKSSTGQASPLMWAKTKSIHGGADVISEPTSPKVTCAGQIKVRHKGGACKTWQSVMEEIEKIHKTTNKNKRQQRQPKRGGSRWSEALGFKKEVFQFLTCLRTIRFDFRCFGTFHGADVTTDDEDDEEEEEDEFEEEKIEAESSRTVFSKWFMVLQEEQSNNNNNNSNERLNGNGEIDDEVEEPVVPPPNALLLMRCRSAPAKSWLEEEEEEEESEQRSKRSLRLLMDEDEKRKTNESVVVMRYQYEPDCEIAKETWLVDGVRDLLCRTRSWKR